MWNVDKSKKHDLTKRSENLTLSYTKLGSILSGLILLE